MTLSVPNSIVQNPIFREIFASSQGGPQLYVKEGTPEERTLRAALGSFGLGESALPEVVRAFQRLHNQSVSGSGVPLAEDGLAGPKTLEALQRQLRSAGEDKLQGGAIAPEVQQFLGIPTGAANLNAPVPATPVNGTELASALRTRSPEAARRLLEEKMGGQAESTRHSAPGYTGLAEAVRRGTAPLQDPIKLAKVAPDFKDAATQMVNKANLTGRAITGEFNSVPLTARPGDKIDDVMKTWARTATAPINHTISPGTDLDVAARDMAQMAQRTGRTVTATHNKIPLTARPGHSVTDVLKDFEKAKKSTPISHLISPGTDLDVAAKDMAQMAQHTGRPVIGMHNKVPLTARPGDSLADVLENFERVRKSGARAGEAARPAAALADGAAAASKAGKVLRGLGKVAVPLGVGLDALDVYRSSKVYAERGDGRTTETKKAVGRAAGGWVGGVAAGAAAGAVFGGWGAIPGAILGGIIGSMGGEKAAEALDAA
ncbi:MAG: hypothetical protein HYV07_33635 [Deltaproteobacteria bacterium]|nr:hypothetical protein [Deltaproteobacteria bacterium]